MNQSLPQKDAKLAWLHRRGRIVPLPRWGIPAASGVGAIRAALHLSDAGGEISPVVSGQDCKRALDRACAEWQGSVVARTAG